jgi:hypothetical protein
VIVAACVILPGVSAYADTVEDLVTFSAGTTARADEVNGNFNEVADAVNGNDIWIAALEAEIAELRTTLEAVDGCATLDPSDEMVRVGSVCIDRYEASVWDAPTGGTQLVTEAQIDATCPDDGQDCKGKIFARSVPGVVPARDITWFQAQQALANSGKRLPTNAEWQMAASGTPDGAPCNVSSSGPVNTGSAAGCISDWGVNDMVGNLWEWVADWVPVSTACPGWSVGSFSSDDTMCLAGASTVQTGPGALIRGGFFNSGTDAGPFAVSGFFRPSISESVFGFRGAR